MAADLVQVEGGQGVLEAQVGLREGAAGLAYLGSVVEVHQVQLVLESGLLLGQVGWEIALDSCQEGSRCEILSLEVLLSLLRTFVRTVCFFATASQTG